MYKERSMPIIVNIENFITDIKSGKRRGKLRTAIKVILLSALEAMADVIVNIDEKPILPSKRDIINIKTSWIIFPINKLKKNKLILDNTTINNKL